MPDQDGGGEWFDERGGLRFECTMCGNCCTGPEGYILVTDDECRAIAKRLGLTFEDFLRDHTHMTTEGRSLNERQTTFGLDCAFLDRETVPGKAVCGIYEDRPAQCRTWPFWSSVIKSERTWRATKRTCPGLDQGPLVTPQQIRVLRDTIEM